MIIPNSVKGACAVHLKSVKPRPRVQNDPSSSFFGLSEKDIEAHNRITRYGDFTLTGAVAPSYDLQVVPRSGWKSITHNQDGIEIPTVRISASSKIVFGLFLDLAELTGQMIDVILETSHAPRCDRCHIDLIRKDMDLLVVLSVFCEFEELLLRDGFLGVALVNPNVPLELNFDDHKLLNFFNWTQIEDQVRAILDRYSIKNDPEMSFITQGEHMHLSNKKFKRQFNTLRSRIGAEPL